MKLLIVLVILALTTTGYAGDEWTEVDYNVDANVKFEVNQASIESISPSIVRAVVKGGRYELQSSKGNWGNIIARETTTDFDCTRPRYKLLDLTPITFSGKQDVIPSPNIPTFKESAAGSLWESVRKFVCKSEGKLQ